MGNDLSAPEPPPLPSPPQPQLQLPPPPSPSRRSQEREAKPSEAVTNREKEAEKNAKLGKQPSGTHQTMKPPEDRKPVIKKMISLSQNLQDILKDADSPIDKSSEDKLYDQLYSGVFLDHKTKKFWVNKKSNCNCFMLYARALAITWAENPNYWRWVPLEESSGTVIEVAELRRVCWLEVHGRFDTRKLSPGILYEVSFHVMLKDPAQYWEIPVNVRLVLPGGRKQEQKQNLMYKMRMKWIEIPVGQFVASAHEDGGDMEVSLYEYGGIWKQGLVIKGISIKPNSDNYRLAL